MIALPLTPGWFHVFRAFAIVAGAVTVFAIQVVLGRGTYVPRFLRCIDDALGTTLGAGRMARFAAAIERQTLDLVRGNPRRLLVLIGATAAVYFLRRWKDG